MINGFCIRLNGWGEEYEKDFYVMRRCLDLMLSRERDILRVMSTFGVQAFHVKWFLRDARDEKLLRAIRCNVCLFSF